MANVLVIPRNRRKLGRGRSYRFKKKAYKRMRICVESFFSWLKSFRRITIRYERLKTKFLELIQMACILIHLKILQ
ncbi:MAG: hypothetical protein DRP08_03645 [Candidatus Aenigmatarchaeota archaeon]|nr:MAG: hypothetical protein DRP08_03645 [Candidatus Aenigmarchaeota archaeon]